VDITVRFAARAIDTVRAVAAAEILPRYRNVAAMEKDDGSTVTAADFASQEALCRRLAALEDVPVIAEEMSATEQHAAWSRGGRLWCIDPLDGTRNFASAIPFFAVSVALMEDGRSVMGIVYDPIADEAFYAVRGAGAWLNHRPLAVPRVAPPLSLAVAEVSLRRDTAHLRGELKRHRPYARRVTSGSSALSWCHLAAARVDVMLHGGQKMWDYAAGALVLEEAGGIASTLENEAFWECDPWSRSVVAARGETLLREWRAWLLARLDRPQPTTDLT
jgi:myo-inositol-1(or 4)-monophosphatase